jgi:hypothetical protein
LGASWRKADIGLFFFRCVGLDGKTVNAHVHKADALDAVPYEVFQTCAAQGIVGHGGVKGGNRGAGGVPTSLLLLHLSDNGACLAY